MPFRLCDQFSSIQWLTRRTTRPPQRHDHSRQHACRLHLDVRPPFEPIENGSEIWSNGLLVLCSLFMPLHEKTHSETRQHSKTAHSLEKCKRGLFFLGEVDTCSVQVVGVNPVSLNIWFCWMITVDQKGQGQYSGHPNDPARYEQPLPPKCNCGMFKFYDTASHQPCNERDGGADGND